jgi:uncharacterized membrane protein YwaF
MEEVVHFYTVQDNVFFGIVLVLELYVIAWSLRFKLDKAGYIILINQLLLMTFKVILSLSK